MPKHLVLDVVVVVEEEVEVAELAAGTVDGAMVVDLEVVETADVTEEVDTEDSQTGRLHCQYCSSFFLVRDS